MDVRSDIFPDTPDGFHPRDVSVRLARPDERIRWDRLMDQHHYLGFKRSPGRGLPYVFEWRGQWVGLAGWQSGAFKCRPRDQWIGWKRELQFTRMHLIANNTRFLILGALGCFPNRERFQYGKLVEKHAKMTHEEANWRLILTQPSGYSNSFSSGNEGKATRDDLHRKDWDGSSRRRCLPTCPPSWRWVTVGLGK